MANLSLKQIMILAWVLVVGALAATAVFLLMTPRGAALSSDDLGRGSYQLVTTEGTPFTQDSLIGEPSVVFFGFTHCPDVCPTTLADISTWQAELGPRADNFRIFVVTVDPERDTAELLSDYVGWLPNAVGVTGEPAQITTALQSFRVFAQKVGSGEDYTVDHSSSVLMFDRDGGFAGTITYQSPVAEALSRLERIL